MIKEKKRTTCFSYIYIYMKYLNFLLMEISYIYIYIYCTRSNFRITNLQNFPKIFKLCKNV